MATQTQSNPFQQFVSGLFGNLSSTPAKKPLGPVAPSGQQPNMTSAITGKPAVGSITSLKPTAGYPGANATYTTKGGAIDSYAQAKGVPYVPSNAAGYGGSSIASNMTSAATGKPAYGGISTSAPKQSIPSSSSSSRTNSARAGTPAVATSAATTGGSSASTSSGAPSQGGSSGVSYSSPGSYSGGGSSAPSDYRKAYTDMLAGMYSSRDLKDANENLDKLNKQTADAQLFDREEERRIRENEQGQGNKTFQGDLRENTRKSTAELADLAIASAPFQEYIKNAMSSAKEMYGVERDADETAYGRTRDTVGDARNVRADALAEKKFAEDVRQFGLRYALDSAQEARLGREAPKGSKQDFVGQYASAFSPGNMMADGTPTVDANGYITPAAFKAAIQEAPSNGITRKEFIEMFGPQLYREEKGDKKTKGTVAAAYGLSPVEQKLVIGTPE